MSNSPLVKYTRLSPNHSGRRTHSIDRITIHHAVGHCSLQTLGNIFAPVSRCASSNYGVDDNGDIGMFVEECNRSWCSSSNANDQRAVTIETADDAYEPYRTTDKALAGLINLCEDICRRNGKTSLVWIPDKAKALAYSQKPNEMLLTVHRWFSATKCPGTYLYGKMGYIAEQVTARLAGKKESSYKVRIGRDDVEIRKGPGTNYPTTGKTTGTGVFTIVEEVSGWGRLKSGAGWIFLGYATRT